MLSIRNDTRQLQYRYLHLTVPWTFTPRLSLILSTLDDSFSVIDTQQCLVVLQNVNTNRSQFVLHVIKVNSEQGRSSWNFPVKDIQRHTVRDAYDKGTGLILVLEDVKTKGINV